MLTSYLDCFFFVLVFAGDKQGKLMVAQIAPAVRVAIAETAGLAPGDVTVGQLVTALRMLGFDYVFGECNCIFCMGGENDRMHLSTSLPAGVGSRTTAWAASRW